MRLIYIIYASQVSANIFRSLPANKNIDFDPDEDEPYLEPSWPHLQVRLNVRIDHFKLNSTDRMWA
jgi:serine/threonine-protein phosphatase 2A regulatory subunit B'